MIWPRSQIVKVDYQDKMHIVLKEMYNTRTVITIRFSSIVFLRSADLTYRSGAHGKEAGVYIFLLTNIIKLVLEF